jgi:hypothetical protein
MLWYTKVECAQTKIDQNIDRIKINVTAIQTKIKRVSIFKRPDSLKIQAKLKKLNIIETLFTKTVQIVYKSHQN